MSEQTTCVFYVATAERATEIMQEAQYTDTSLTEEGFIHLCKANQVGFVLETFYSGMENIKLLVIDPSLLDAELKFEAPVPNITDDQSFPHLYGPLNTNAIVDVIDAERFNQKAIHPDTLAMLRHYRFERLPVEGTLYKSTWRSETNNLDGGPVGTAMIGMYANEPESVSCFHKLDFEEAWHFYGGDPFTLYLLYPDGTTAEIKMGTDPTKDQYVQYVIPAGVWQAGCLDQGGRYALFGCTMAPGFTGTCFEAGVADELIAAYPSKASIIHKLSINGHEKLMPEGFAS